MARSAPVSRVLSLQSEVVFGHVGNSAARFALQRVGIEVLALPTVLFSNHPGHGGFRGRPTASEDLKDLLAGLEERGFLDGIDAVLSGYLGDAAHAQIVRDAVVNVKRRNSSALYLLDPVFGDDGGAYARPGVAEAMARDLLPLADIVTPNRFELASLAGQSVATEADTLKAARSLGRQLVLATSVPGGALIGTAAITASDAWVAWTPRIVHPPNGVGDLMAALFLGRRLTGDTVPAALGRAAGIIAPLIAASAGAKDVQLISLQDVLVSNAMLPVTPLLP